MLTVWGRRDSFNLQKVMWLVDELELPHEHIMAGGRFGGLDDPEYLEMNPHGRVPAIKDGDAVVWESQTILRYLAAQYGTGIFWSGDPAERSLAERWMDWSQATLQPDFLLGIFWGFYRTPEAQRNMPAIERKIERCSAHFRLLDAWLNDRDFMAGAQFSLADIPIGTHLYRYFNVEIERPEIPKVGAWYERLQQRPAYQKNVMLPFDDLYGRLAY